MAARILLTVRTLPLYVCLIAIGAGVVSFEFHLFDCFSFVSVLYIIVFPNENWTDDPRLLQTPYWRSPSVPILHLDFKTNFKIVFVLVNLLLCFILRIQIARESFPKTVPHFIPSYFRDGSGQYQNG